MILNSAATYPGEDALAASEAARKALARLVAVAGHDLKQPLQIAMFSIARAAEGDIPARTARRLGTALEAMRRLSDELDDIARLSQRGESLRARPRVIRLDVIAQSVERDWRDYARTAGITLRIALPALFVETDPAMLGTILRNLVGNALKSSGRGGEVRIGYHVGGDGISIDVHDDGMGIAPGLLDRIFDAFERGGRTDDGLGLGLTIVRQTAELLGHRISVRSVEGKGSTFSVEMPAFRCIDPPITRDAAAMARRRGKGAAARPQSRH